MLPERPVRAFERKREPVVSVTREPVPAVAEVLVLSPRPLLYRTTCAAADPEMFVYNNPFDTDRSHGDAQLEPSPLVAPYPTDPPPPLLIVTRAVPDNVGAVVNCPERVNPVVEIR